MTLQRTTIILMAVLLLAGCGLPPASDIPATPTAPPTATEPPAPLATQAASPTPERRDRLIVCSGAFPTDLFLYSEPTYIKSVVLSALYDGPIEMSAYEYHPVILTKLPSLADGDAWIEPVAVAEGDLVMDAGGALAALAPGTIVRPAGCRSGDCAIAYENGTVQMDRMRAVFNIRPGVQWTDGSPLTAADSVFSYQLSRSEEILYGNAGLVSNSATSVTFTADYSAVDANTVQWTGLPGFLDPNYPLNFFSPLPAGQLAGIPILDLLAREDVLYSPAGWGPYRVTSWDAGESLTLEANPNYDLAGEGLPSIQEVVIRVVGQDPATSLLAFGLGECDLLLQDSLPNVPVDELLTVEAMLRGRVYTDLQPLYEQLTFNIAPADPQQPAIFAEPRLRQAAAFCIDRPGLAELVYAGLVPALEMSLPGDHPLLQGAPVDLFRYDPQKAGQVLDGLGWLDTNGDGLREAHGVPGIDDGLPLIVRLSVPESDLRSRVGEYLASQLQVCGFQVMLENAPARDLFAQNEAAIGSGRRFDLLETASPMNIDGLCGLAETDRISGEGNAWSGSNLSGYSLPALDDACARMRASLPGTEDYTASRQAVLRIMNDTVPVLPLFVYVNFTVSRSDLSGVTTGLGQGELQDLERFHWEP